MKKVFRALGPEVVEKKWIGKSETIPDGWHEAISGALDAWKAPEAIVTPEPIDEPVERVKRPYHRRRP